MSKNGGKNRGWIFYPIAVLSALLFLLLKSNNIVRWIQAGFTIAGQEKEMEEARKNIERMDARLDGLENSLDSVETFARENFYFPDSSEDVYLTR